MFIGAPSQAFQIIFEMQTQRSSQNRAVKKIRFSNCKLIIVQTPLVKSILVIHKAEEGGGRGWVGRFRLLSHPN
jgi:hypothetical protein